MTQHVLLQSLETTYTMKRNKFYTIGAKHHKICYSLLLISLFRKINILSLLAHSSRAKILQESTSLEMGPFSAPAPARDSVKCFDSSSGFGSLDSGKLWKPSVPIPSPGGIPASAPAPSKISQWLGLPLRLRAKYLGSCSAFLVVWPRRYPCS